jgi:hypothetical protein
MDKHSKPYTVESIQSQKTIDCFTASIHKFRAGNSEEMEVREVVAQG